MIIGWLSYSGLEESAVGQDGLCDGCADGGHGAVDDLAELEVHGYAAEEVGGLGGESPGAGEKCSTRGGGARGAGGVSAGRPRPSHVAGGGGGGADSMSGPERGCCEWRTKRRETL